MLDEELFFDLKSNWNSLYNLNTKNSIFQSFELNYSAYKYLEGGTGLNILVFFNSSNQLVVIFPLVLSNGILRYIGAPHIDYGDIVSRDLSQSCYSSMFSTLYKYVLSNTSIRGFCLNSVSSSSAIIPHFMYRFKLNSFVSDLIGYSNIRFENYNQWLSTLPSSKKSELRRIIKNSGEIKSHTFYNDHSVSFPRDLIVLLRNRMIYSKIRNEEFLANDFINLLEVLFYEGCIKLHVLKESDRLIALNIILINRDKYLFWIDLYNPKVRNSNLLSYLFYLNQNCNSPVSNYQVDFGRGLYQYKVKNFQPNLGFVLTVQFYKSTLIYFRFYIFKNVRQLLKNIYLVFFK